MRSIVAGKGDPIVKQLYNYRGLVINCQPFQRLPRLQSSSCCALALTPRPRAINSLTFHRQTYLPVKLNGRRIRDYLLNQFPKTAIVEARARPLSRDFRKFTAFEKRYTPRDPKTEKDGKEEIFRSREFEFFAKIFLFFSFVVWNLLTAKGGRHREDLERGTGSRSRWSSLERVNIGVR